MRYKEEDVQNLIENLDIVEVVSKYVNLKHSGANYKGLCPFHSEKSPSFMVSPGKNLFKCFGCGEAGSALSFYMKVNKFEFKDALEALAKEYNFNLRAEKGYDGSTEFRSVRDRYYSILSEASFFFKETLFSPSGANALQYLLKRGLTLEFINRNSLGFAPDGWGNLIDALKKKGYSEDELIKCGLAKKSEKGTCYDIFRNRVIFPIYNFDSKVVGFGGRIMSDEKDVAKYLNSPETEIFSKGKNLYGLINRGEKVRKKQYVMLAEGYMDVLTAHFHGFDNTVASLGTAFTEEQAKLLKRLTSNVVISYDMDEAGKVAVERAAHILKKFDFNIKVINYTEAKDPDEFLNKLGRERFIEKIKESIEIFDFIYLANAKNFNLADTIGKRKFIESFDGFFKSVTNKVELNIYVDKLAANLGVDKATLRDAFRHEGKEQKHLYIDLPKKDAQFDKLELLTVKLILKDKHYYSNFENRGIILKIQHPLLCKVLNLVMKNIDSDDLEALLIKGGDFSPDEEKIIIETFLVFDEVIDEKLLFSDLVSQWENTDKTKELDEIKKRINMSTTSMEDKSLLTKRYLELVRSMKN